MRFESIELEMPIFEGCISCKCNATLQIFWGEAVLTVCKGCAIRFASNILPAMKKLWPEDYEEALKRWIKAETM